MVRQKRHVRVSKKGKAFRAGKKKVVSKVLLFEVLDSPKLFHLLNYASGLVSESGVQVSAQGVNIRAMDPANVAMVSVMAKAGKDGMVKVFKSSFFGVNIENLKNVIKGKKGSLLFYRMKDKLLIVDKMSWGAFSTNIPLIDIEPPTSKSGKPMLIKIPELKTTYSISIDSKALVQVLNEAKNVTGLSGSIRFFANNNSLGFKVESDINKSEGNIDGVSSGKTGVSSKYSVEYLKKAAPVLSRVYKKATLKFGNDYPLVLDYKDKNSESWMILAPRVDND